MRLICPWCGERDAGEFTYKGDASVKRPTMDNESEADHAAYIYDRENPVGWHRENWQHTGGCRAHVTVERHTVTHEVKSCEALGPWKTHFSGGVKT